MSLKLNRSTDSDILDRLETVENRQGYIKKAIRAYIEAEERPQE